MSAVVDAVECRFCQQCGKFQPLEEFDADKRYSIEVVLSWSDVFPANPPMSGGDKGRAAAWYCCQILQLNKARRKFPPVCWSWSATVPIAELGAAFCGVPLRAAGAAVRASKGTTIAGVNNATTRAMTP
jgi:hypothetical protein